ncbi:MAG TPA: tetratricopeptide repeat protein [Myxococcaceae bacterium]|nr:tetratricopeptide repeat protein [Myxococcaceae bacterium]
MALFGRKRAEQEVALGNAAADAGDSEAAEHHYRRAMMLAPEWSVPLYNIGLAAKYRSDWPIACEFSRRASDLNPADQASAWNWAIAATALGKWDEADAAWRRCGIQVPDGSGARDWRLGPIPIRLEEQEVVWCTRLDPARARIDNVPFEETGYRYGDVLLHDGAPQGARMFRGIEYPVFNALALLERSPYRTFVASVYPGDDVSLKSLEALSSKPEIALEDWSTVRILCRACSEGNPDTSAPHNHNRELAEGERRVVFAARDLGAVETLLNSWARGGSTRGYSLVAREPE